MIMISGQQLILYGHDTMMLSEKHHEFTFYKLFTHNFTEKTAIFRSSFHLSINLISNYQ